MRQDYLIDELDFILTHPAVKPENLEGFYRQCLMAYPTVPVYKIVDHVYKTNKHLLAEWSAVNSTIRHAVVGLGVELLSNSEENLLSILIPESELKVIGGYYVYDYKSTLEFNSLRTLHLLGKIRIRSRNAVDLIAIREVHSGTYKLYLKRKGRETT